MNYKYVFLSILIFFALVAICGTVTKSEYKFHDTFVGYNNPNKNNWTILNMEHSGVTSEEIQSALDTHYAYHIINYTIKDVLRNSSELVYYQYPSHFKTKWVAFGRDDYTVVVLNKDDYQSWDDELFDKYIGGAYEKHAFILMRESDGSYNMAVRLIHEMGHGELRDSDGMFTSQKNNFTTWMTMVKYPYINSYKNEKIFKNFMPDDVKQVYLDYHLWLYTN
jgi:hypothetical protein